MAKVAAFDAPGSIGSKVILKLLKDEKGGLMWEEGVCSVTIYSGKFAEQSLALREQFKKVILANPWLAGRLVKSKEDGISLSYPENPSDEEISFLFHSISLEDKAGFKISPNTSYVDMCRSMYKSKKVVVGNGSYLVKNKAPCTLLTITEISAGEFAIIFSISHVIGDGRTKYDILKMLQPGATVSEMKSTRMMNFSEAMRDVCGRKEIEWMDRPSSLIMMIGAVMPAMMGCKKVTCTAFKVDPERIDAAKKAAVKESGVEYVSTNDIITSAFFNACKIRIGLMGLDCRGRIDGITDNLAGNYVTALVMDQETYATPATVRKMLSSTPYQTTGRPLPNCCSWCMGGKVKTGMITNWYSFTGNLVQLEGCKIKIHLPVLNPDMVMWDNMVPFAYEAGKIGLLCFSTSCNEDGLRAALPVGECVSKELFP